MGWTGTAKQLYYALQAVGANRDNAGKFILYGDPVVSFLGLGEDVVVSDRTNYAIGKRRCNLAGLMQNTSYGIGAVVICTSE